MIGMRFVILKTLFICYDWSMGKKVILFAFLLLGAVVLLSCCKTSEAAPDDDVTAALYQAGSMAVDEAFSQLLIKDLSSFDFLPGEAAYIEGQADRIPGMKYLIREWNTSAAEYCKAGISYYPEFFKTLVSQLQFVSPQNMLLSNTSITDQLKREKAPEIEGEIYSRLLSDMDTSGFSSIIGLYNDYLITESVFTKGTYHLVEMEVLPYLASLMTDIVFSELAVAEEKVRTTPDLDLDSNFVRVFKLDN